MRSEHCPDIVVGWRRAVEVGGGEEKRLGGSFSESFLNEGSEQYRPLRGSCTSARIRKSQEDFQYSSTEEEMTFLAVHAG